MKNIKCFHFHVSMKPKPVDKSLKAGYRPYFNDHRGTYIGEWLNNKRHGFGTLFHKNNFIYDGQWKDDVLDGQGSIRQKLQNGRVVRIYIGEFKNNMKDGEGKRIYSNGIYFGNWCENKRSGIGIHWYNDGAYYLGEWCNDMYNGAGILKQKNGNRYEGFWRNNLKHDEGTFYHLHTGQLQKGIWVDDYCKTSIMQDEFRQTADFPTEYPIDANLRLADPDAVVYKVFRSHMDRAVKCLRNSLVRVKE